jgi:hypothetical protein
LASGFRSSTLISRGRKSVRSGKIEAFWAMLNAEVLDRQLFTRLTTAELAFAEYHCYTTTTG